MISGGGREVRPQAGLTSVRLGKIGRLVCVGLIAVSADGCSRSAGMFAPSRPDRVDEQSGWDGSSSVRQKDGRLLFFQGPVLGRAESGLLERQMVIAPATGRDPLTSTRCALLAHGVPYLRPSANLSDGLTLVRGEWERSALAEGDLCASAFGSGWHLPTVAELESYFAQQARSTHRILRGFARRIGGEPVEVIHLRVQCERSGKRRSCREAPTTMLERSPAAPVYCASTSNDEVEEAPSETEIRVCVDQFKASISRDIEPQTMDPHLVDLAFELEKACPGPVSEARWRSILNGLELRILPSGLRQLRQELTLEHSRLPERLRRLTDAFKTLRGDWPTGEGCQMLREVHEANCGAHGGAETAFCTRYQVALRAQCDKGADAGSLLEQAVSDLSQREFDVAMARRRLQTLQMIVAHAKACLFGARTREAKAVLARLVALDADGSDPSRPPAYCACPQGDLECNLAALISDKGCLEERPHDAPEASDCRCHPTDAACQLQCRAE
jgi:hypothetical protein